MRVIALFCAALLSQQVPPVPQPFPRPGTAQPTRPPAQPAPGAPAATAPSTSKPDADAPGAALLGAPVYPGAQYLTSYDAGRGQRFYIFGSTASFLDLVA